VRTVGVDAQTAFPVGPARLRNGHPMAWPLRFPPGESVAALIVAGLNSTGGTASRLI
jgi:hypothetical protein